MKWHLESWRKIYRTCPPSWLRLSVSARGLGSELLKYAEDDGSIDVGNDPPGLAVAYMLGARPREHKRIAEDVAELLRDGYLVHQGQQLLIRNFVEAQDRTPGAKRTAEWRARKSEAQTPQRDVSRTSPDASHVTSHVTSHVHTSETSIRSDPTRHETIRREPPVGPPGARAIASATATPFAAKMVPASGTPSQGPVGARETGRETPAKPIGDRKRPATRMPPEPEVDAWLAKLSIPPRASSVESAKFVDYHLARGSVMADWAAAWRTWTRNSVEFAQRAPARGRSLGGIQPQSTLWRPKAVNDPEDPLPDAKPGELAL